jgi:hypothetical protein
MENNLYYTPTIEEFHVGFEYEYKNIQGIWVDLIFEVNMIVNYPKENKVESIIYSWLKEDKVRVKTLNKEDIEDLGWKEDSRFLGTNAVMLNSDRYKIIHKDTIHDLYKNGDKYGICCNNTNPTHIFYGYIKNKSELIKLMQQLNIK